MRNTLAETQNSLRNVLKKGGETIVSIDIKRIYDSQRIPSSVIGLLLRSSSISLLLREIAALKEEALLSRNACPKIKPSKHIRGKKKKKKGLLCKIDLIPIMRKVVIEEFSANPLASACAAGCISTGL
jgi:hypothetical protein